MTDASPRRLAVAALVIAVHGVLLALLLRSVTAVAPPPVPAIELVNIAAPPPPAPPPPPATVAAAPASPAAAAAPAQPLPAPAAPAPVAAPVAAATPTTPASSGTTGTASATGGSGTADGGGGVVRAVHVSGAITNRDYPRAANAAGVGGSVTVVFDVRADGGVEHCRVVVPSGSALLDTATCTLIEQRFRYAPARDAHGNAIGDVAGWKQDWWLAR
jgi:protein TonB